MRTLKHLFCSKSFRSQHHKSKGADSIHRNSSTKYKKRCCSSKSRTCWWCQYQRAFCQNRIFL